MINIIIIDDEPLVRASIQSFWKWESYGFSFIGEASDGIEGLELIDSRKDVDLLLLDIHMPRMNGIEFLQELNKRSNPPKVIVLSANDHYDYVRESFRLGAIDYILKMNIDEKTLLNILQKTEKKLGQKRKGIPDINSKDIEYMGHKLILDLIENRNTDITTNLLKDININIKSPLRIYYLWLNNSELNTEFENDLELIVIQARQFLKKRAEGCLTSIIRGEWLFLINMNDTNSEDNISVSFCNDFIQIIENSLGLNMDFAISPICQDMNKLPEYYKYVKSLHHPETRMVRKAKKYIQENYANNKLSLVDISEYVEVSKTHFSSQFKKETELTFRTYLTKIRVEEAKKLLQNTNLKVYEISEIVGYPNVEHFSRIFKKETSLTPNRFASNYES